MSADGETLADREGIFADWSTQTLADQCHMQAREQLDPEFSQFMTACGNRLAALTRRAGGDAIPAVALADVAAERARQITVEGWTPEHDDKHTDRSLALAAACYLMFAAASNEARAATDMPGSLAALGKPIKGWAAFLQIWPWDRRWWKPTTRRADLVKAGALIIAEIERLDRKEAARG